MAAREADGSSQAGTGDIAVRRRGAAVRVESGALLDGAGVDRLRDVLLDLIEGQGNLTIEVDLPQVTAVDVRLLEVLVEAQMRVSSRRGHFSVTTQRGSWEPSPTATAGQAAS